MWKVYLKQIKYLLKENKFFSMVYILGTALSITMVMLILMAYHLKTGNIGAEDKRDRMLSVTAGYVVMADEPDGFYSSAFLNAGMVEKWFYPLKTPEAVSMFGKTSSVVHNERENRYEELSATYTDAGFWKLFSPRFVAGRGFSAADVKSKACKVVIDATTARRLLGTTQAVGHTLHIDWKEYKVCGVVEDVPSYLACAFSRLYFPYTTTPQSAVDWGQKETPLGPMAFYLLLRSPEDRAKVTQEMEHQIQVMNGTKKYIFSLKDQPNTFLEKALRMGNQEGLKETSQRLYVMIAIVILLLVIPALNLSGLIVARMRKRREEIGIRKAFGASAGNLMWQVLWENFMQMFLGSVLGLFLSAGLFQCVRSALLANSNGLWFGTSTEAISSITFWHLISPVTVCYVIGACFLLNLLSTLLPAWRYTRMPVVEALNRN